MHQSARNSIELAVVLSFIATGLGVSFPSRSLLAQGTDSTPPKSYAAVIPSTAETRRSFVTIHRVGDRIHLEIPVAQLEKEMIFLKFGSHSAQRLVRFDRVGNRIMLRVPKVVSTHDSAYAQWAAAHGDRRLPSIIAEFPIETFSPEGSPVIDATRLFTGALPVIETIAGHDDARTFITRTAGYPRNVVVEAVETMTGGGTYTLRVRRQLVQLPETPMKPRLFDDRAGFFGVGDTNVVFGLTREGHVNALRWRMEKKDPKAAVSEPVTPIVFYLEPGTPARWKEWIKAGVEAWQPAFEAAGFKNAILAKDPPVGDSAWSIDDIRNSTVQWWAQPNEQARDGGGGSANWVIDYRTGEILKCEVLVGEDMIPTIRNWYFTQSSPSDPRAQKLPFPDSLMGALIQSLISHEVGHCLGLMDGNYGKYGYPVDSVRSKTWVRKMGHTPGVINYARNNYVAQPEDSIALGDLIQRVGPADVFQIKWGYTPIDDARSPLEELPTLDRWAQVQDTVPWLRFVPEVMHPGGGIGRVPGPYTLDANDDNDPIRSTGYGLKNLRRVMKILPQATVVPGGDVRDLQDLYQATIGQRGNELERVVDLIGGFVIQRKSGAQPGVVYTPIASRIQREAIRFLDTAGFETPTWLIVPELTRRFEAEGGLARIVNAQNNVLGDLLSMDRFQRVLEQDALRKPTEPRYPLAEMLRDIRRGVWKELDRGKVVIDPVRRGVQAAYLSRYQQMLAEPARGGIATQVAALLKADLKALRTELTRASPKAADPETRAHLTECQELVDRALKGNR